MEYVDESEPIIWDYSKYKDQKFILPEIVMPFKAVISPHEDVITKKQEKWVKETLLPPNQNNLISAEKYLSDQLIKMYTNCFSLLSEDNLFSVAKIHDILFVIDDCYYETNIKDINYSNIITDESAIDKHDHLGKELWIAINEMYKNGIKENVDLAVYDIKQWFYDSLDVNHNNLSKQVLVKMTIEEYVEFRTIDVGMPLIHSLVTTTIPISNEIRETDAFKQLKYWNSYTNLLFNDCISFKKEALLQTYSNYIKIKTFQCGSIQQALNYTIEMVNKSISNEKIYCDQLIQLYPNNQDIIKLTDTFKALSSGHLELMKKCNRYNNNEKK